MVAAFCRWPRSDVGVKGGIVAIVKQVPTILCWMWTYGEHEKK